MFALRKPEVQDIEDISLDALLGGDCSDLGEDDSDSDGYLEVLNMLLIILSYCQFDNFELFYFSCDIILGFNECLRG